MLKKKKNGKRKERTDVPGFGETKCGAHNAPANDPRDLQLVISFRGRVIGGKKVIKTINDRCCYIFFFYFFIINIRKSSKQVSAARETL